MAQQRTNMKSAVPETQKIKKLIFVCQEDPQITGPVPVGRQRVREHYLVRALTELVPVTVVATQSNRNQFKALLRSEEFHPDTTAVWISQLVEAEFIAPARRRGFRMILDEHQIVSRARFFHALSSPKYWWEIPQAIWLARKEISLCSQVHKVVTSSEIDATRLKKIVRKLSTENVHVIRTCIDTERFSPARTGDGVSLYFCGQLDASDNVEGLKWFLRAILPRLRVALKAKMPRVVIAGRAVSPELKMLLNQPGIELHEDPVSVLPTLAQARVVFVPVLSEGGARLKILEAMAAGKPVVTTGTGAEGLILMPGENVSIDRTADGFTSSILQLLNDRKLRDRYRASGLANVQKNHDWQSTIEPLKKLLLF